MEYNLIPINGKNPPCVPWKRWESERVSLDLLGEWLRRQFTNSSGRQWTLGPEATLNFGVPTGKKPYSPSPALVVVDSDDEVADALVARRCPATPARQRTPGSGWHRVYRRPAEPDYIPIRQGTVVGGVHYKVDIRADHGYFMAPLSICPKRGTFYQWVEPWTLDMFHGLPIYDPNWLPHEQPEKRRKKASSSKPDNITFLDHDDALSQSWLLPLDLRIDAAVRYLERCPGSTAGRKADNYCFALAMTLVWGFALPADEAVELLVDWGERSTNVDEQGNYYPWTSQEILHKIENAVCHAYCGVLGDRLDPTAWLTSLAEEYIN
jgi:hypothetical protein